MVGQKLQKNRLKLVTFRSQFIMSYIYPPLFPLTWTEPASPLTEMMSAQHIDTRL